MMIDKYNVFILDKELMIKAGGNNFLNRVSNGYLIKKKGGDLRLDIKENDEWTNRNVLIDNYIILYNIILGDNLVCFKGFSDKDMIMFINNFNKSTDSNINIISFNNNSDKYLYERSLLRKTAQKKVQKFKKRIRK